MQGPVARKLFSICKLCADTGYGGRTGIFELLIMSEKIGKMLTGNASYDEIRKQAFKEEMATLKHGGMLKVKEGITTVDEVAQAALTLEPLSASSRVRLAKWATLR